jgi:hypothetical protein
MKRIIVALVLGLSLIAAPAAQTFTTISGDARTMVTKPYDPYKRFVVRARNTQTGDSISAFVGADGLFTIAPVPNAEYVVELLNPKNKIICTEGPFTIKNQERYITVECAKKDAALWWTGVAAGAAILAVGTLGPYTVASGSR